MKIKAMVSFAGVVTLTKGDIYDCKDEEIAKELCKSGLAEEVKSGREKANED